MTNQEAIASLKTLCHTCELFPKCVNDKPECYQAIELAISALEAQESSQNVTNGDFILRKAAIDVAKKLLDDYGTNAITKEFADDVAEIYINKVPSVQPDGIPLEWIDKHLEWLDNCDNDFAQLAKVGIRAMVEIWKKDKT